MKKKLSIVALLVVVVMFVFAAKSTNFNLNKLQLGTSAQTEEPEKKVKKRGIARALDFWRTVYPYVSMCRVLPFE